MSEPDANVERFDTLAADWDSDPVRVITGQKVARAILAAIDPQGTETALEFGAGTGLLTLLIAPRVARLTALDSSDGMLAVLRDKCRRKHRDNVTVIAGGVPAYLPAGPFDLIYSSLTLHHIENVQGLLGALIARLAPGGRVALADVDTEDGSFHGEAKGVAHHGFDRDEFGHWLAAAGFADIAFSTAFEVPHQTETGERRYPIFLAVARKPA